MFGGLPSASKDITKGSFSIPIVSSEMCSKTGSSVINYNCKEIQMRFK